MRIPGQRIKEWRVGDRLAGKGSEDEYCIVGFDKDDCAIIFMKFDGAWCYHQRIYPSDIEFDYDLIGVDADDFYLAGFGPVTYRPYVIFKEAAGAVLIAGCRTFRDYARAARHWRRDGNSDKPLTKRAIAKAAFAEARRRGWLKVKRQPPVKKKVVKRRPR